MLKKLLTRLDVKLFDRFVAVVETGETLDRDFSYQQDNRQSWYNVTAVKLGDGFSVMVRDITQRKRWELELNRLANLDGLTQVANRHCFNHTLTVEWRRCNCSAMWIILNGTTIATAIKWEMIVWCEWLKLSVLLQSVPEI